MRGAVLSAAKPGVPGLFSAGRIWCSDPSGPLSHFSNWSKLFRSVCVYRPNWMNSSACTCYVTFLSLGFQWLWVEQSWQYTILPIYSVDYTPLENWCQLICYFCIFRDLRTASAVVFQESVRSKFLSFSYSPQISGPVCPGLQPLTLVLSCESFAFFAEILSVSIQFWPLLGR